MDIDTGQDDFASILVPQSRLPLYADLTEHNLNPSAAQTRSDEGTVPLSELLDKDQTATTQHDGTSVKPHMTKVTCFLLPRANALGSA